MISNEVYPQVGIIKHNKQNLLVKIRHFYSCIWSKSVVISIRNFESIMTRIIEIPRRKSPQRFIIG